MYSNRSCIHHKSTVTKTNIITNIEPHIKLSNKPNIVCTRDVNVAIQKLKGKIYSAKIMYLAILVKGNSL